MNVFPVALLCASCLFAAPVVAQWQWLDEHGRKVFSDRAPPPQVPAERILRQPSAAPSKAALPSAANEDPSVAAPAQPLPAGGVSTPPSQPRSPAPAPTPTEPAKAATLAEEKKQARAREENCTRARAALIGLSDGRLMTHTNSLGERVFMDDATRASERQRIEGLIAESCAPMPRAR